MRPLILASSFLFLVLGEVVGANELKPLTFEKKKELARKKCMSIGFRDETIDMKNCILKFVTEQ